MRASLLFFVVVALVATSAFAGNDKELGDKKFNDLLKMSKNSPFITMTGAEFNYYVRTGPRPYHVVAFLTSNMGTCSMCNDLGPQMTIFADSVEAARYEATDSYKENPDHRIFVVEFDGSKNYQTFQEMGLKTVPHLNHVPPTRSSKAESWSKVLKDQINLSPGWKAEDIARNLHSRMKRSINIERPPEPIPWGNIAISLVSIVGVLYFFLTIGRSFIMKYLSNPLYYAVAAMLFYGFCVGGGMYNRIRNTPWMGQDQQGNPQMISASSNSQYGAEGYTIAGLNLLIAISLITMTSFSFKLNTNAINRNVLVFGGLVAFVLMWRQLRGIYTMKNRGYNNGFVW